MRLPFEEIHAGNIMSSRVMLYRNYAGLPFNTEPHPENADHVLELAEKGAMAYEAAHHTHFDLIPLVHMSRVQKNILREDRVLRQDPVPNPKAALLLCDGDSLHVNLNDRDHVIIHSASQGLRFSENAEKCYQMEKALQTEESFAYDETFGYLSSSPMLCGTGMRLEANVHLPALVQCNKMGQIGQIVAKARLRILSVMGVDGKAPAHIYRLENVTSLGRDEETLMMRLEQVAQQLSRIEDVLTDKLLKEKRAQVEDSIFRSYAILREARLMSFAEFLHHWSGLRMGARCRLLPLDEKQVDSLLYPMQEWHLKATMAERQTEENHTEGDVAEDEFRAELVRERMRKMEK